jgi:fructose-1,6-bisphosphatase I
MSVNFLPGRSTIIQFILEEERRSGCTTTGDLTGLLLDIVRSCKQISGLVSYGDLAGIYGKEGASNVQGEEQLKLDVLTHNIMVSNNEWSGHLAGMASEEVEDVISIPDKYPKGKYLLLFDPLDGSSNLEINVGVGTIFSILRCPQGVHQPQVEDFLQPGTQQVCAGYCMYGQCTTMILTTGSGVNGFTLHPGIGEFILTHPKITIPEDTKEFAINMSNRRHWDPPITRYVTECEAGKTGPRAKDFNMRWVASMVAEVHRILMRGGVWMYPIDARIKDKGGRLRLLYEVNPMSFLIEQAGGAASTGAQRALEVIPTGLHQRVPVILGSKNEVERIVQYHHEHQD